jgi:hypothetical protein
MPAADHELSQRNHQSHGATAAVRTIGPGVLPEIRQVSRDDPWRAGSTDANYEYFAPLESRHMTVRGL